MNIGVGGKAPLMRDTLIVDASYLGPHSPTLEVGDTQSMVFKAGDERPIRETQEEPSAPPRKKGPQTSNKPDPPPTSDDDEESLDVKPPHVQTPAAAAAAAAASSSAAAATAPSRAAAVATAGNPSSSRARHSRKVAVPVKYIQTPYDDEYGDLNGYSISLHPKFRPGDSVIVLWESSEGEDDEEYAGTVSHVRRRDSDGMEVIFVRYDGESDLIESVAEHVSKRYCKQLAQHKTPSADAAGSDDDALSSRGKKRGRDASEADSSDHIGLAKGMWQVLRERGAVIKGIF